MRPLDRRARQRGRGGGDKGEEGEECVQRKTRLTKQYLPFDHCAQWVIALGGVLNNASPMLAARLPIKLPISTDFMAEFCF